MCVWEGFSPCVYIYVKEEKGDDLIDVPCHELLKHGDIWTCREEGKGKKKGRKIRIKTPKRKAGQLECLSFSLHQVIVFIKCCRCSCRLANAV